jgi:hypothetical protein
MAPPACADALSLAVPALTDTTLRADRSGNVTAQHGTPQRAGITSAGLGGAAPAAPGWAQVVDVRVTRTVTEWVLPGLVCPCCGTAAIAVPPSGAHAGSAGVAGVAAVSMLRLERG